MQRLFFYGGGTINTKKEKLLDELEDLKKKIQANDDKIKSLTEKNEDLKKRKRKAKEKLREIEDGEHGLICREYNVAPEDLAAFFESQKKMKQKKEETETE